MREGQTFGITIEREIVDDVVVLHLSGQVREMGADALREELDQVLEKGYFKLIFDLGDVSFISSTGLGQMMRVFRAAKGNDGYVRVVNPQPLVEEVFRFTKLHTLIGIYPNLEEALQAE
ncbi:MAG: STAS domain-containing protein [Candidatus Brocadiae bacterium]|nr:STAS domain-containing protein [Candidatus Brocadiia bacterium]